MHENPASSQISVRPLGVGESRLVRELRVRALRDSPTAFAQTEAEALSQSDDVWLRLAESMTGAARNAMFVAESGEEFVGCTYALVDQTDEQVGRVGGFWVDSRYRRLGIGRQLLRSVGHWAIARQRDRLRLWVPADAFGARAFYLAQGFAETGTVRAFPTAIKRFIQVFEITPAR